MANKVPPLCPETPPREHHQAPHRDLPPKPRHEPRPTRERLQPQYGKWAPGEYELFQDVVNSYREQRKEALETIKNFRGSTQALDPAQVRAARAFLDNWRTKLFEDLDTRFKGFSKRHPQITLTPPERPPRPTKERPVIITGTSSRRGHVY